MNLPVKARGPQEIHRDNPRTTKCRTVLTTQAPGWLEVAPSRHRTSEMALGLYPVLWPLLFSLTLVRTRLATVSNCKTYFFLAEI
jgi:hypothetical protein